MNRGKIFLSGLIVCSVLILKPILVQATNPVVSGWLGTEDILFTISCSSPSETPYEWVIGEKVTVDFTFKSYQQYWGVEWEYPLKIHRLEVELSGSGISYKETIATDKVLNYLDDLRRIVEVTPTYKGEVTCVIDISFEINDLAHKGSMADRLERFTFQIATARDTTYDKLNDYYVNSKSTISSLQGQLNIIHASMWVFVASTIGLLFTTVYFAGKRKSKVKS